MKIQVVTKELTNIISELKEQLTKCQLFNKQAILSVPDKKCESCDVKKTCAAYFKLAVLKSKLEMKMTNL